MATILIAEDDADIRDLVVFKLEQSGHTVIPVGDGRSALRVAGGGRILSPVASRQRSRARSPSARAASPSTAVETSCHGP